MRHLLLLFAAVTVLNPIADVYLQVSVLDIELPLH